VQFCEGRIQQNSIHIICCHTLCSGVGHRCVTVYLNVLFFTPIFSVKVTPCQKCLKYADSYILFSAERISTLLSRRSATKSSRSVPLPYQFLILTIEQFFVQIIPICFSRGSAKRVYESLTVDRGDYDIEITPASATTSTAITNGPTVKTTNKISNLNWLREDWPPWDWRQWAEESWEYLLDPPREVGPILCVSRGKQLVIAAGHVSKVLRWHSTIY